ncbi:GAF domain-containing protein [Streptomyces chiangmaiensis]
MLGSRPADIEHGGVGDTGRHVEPLVVRNVIFADLFLPGASLLSDARSPSRRPAHHHAPQPLRCREDLTGQRSHRTPYRDDRWQSPSFFTLPGRMALDAPYASARALTSGKPAVLVDPDPPDRISGMYRPTRTSPFRSLSPSRASASAPSPSSGWKPTATTGRRNAQTCRRSDRNWPWPSPSSPRLALQSQPGGHSGASPSIVRNLHGAGLHARTPATEALLGRPLFISDSRSTAAGSHWPDEESQAEAYLPLMAGRHITDLPFAGRGKIVGVCCLSFPRSRGFPPEERAVLSMMAGLLGAAVERVQLSAKQRAVAEHLQQRLLPPPSPSCPG